MIYVFRMKRLIHDLRVSHFWDGGDYLAKAYGTVIRKRYAWDIVFSFDPHAEWTDRSPIPAKVMSKIGAGDGFNGNRLHEHIQALLKGVSKP